MKHFIREHAEDDLSRLLLSAARYPGIDVAFAAGQIACRRKIREKLPSWYANDDLVFPATLATEQCSSEQTARYKQRLVSRSAHVCDLTGGLGIDSFFFSRKARQVTYVERLGTYCEAARHNFACLGADIDVCEGEAEAWIPRLPASVDTFYIDPARRSDAGKRLFALEECEPDLTALLPALLQRAPRVIAKLSPMADLKQTLRLLPGTTEVHLLSLRNECKELLFVITQEEAAAASPPIHCIHFTADGKEQAFTFTLREEQETATACATAIETYLYEPNASILKAGAFKSITRLGVGKLQASSHLYTSSRLLDDFPGRRFVVDDVFPFGSKLCKNLHKSIPQAHITTRNFPLTAEALRRRTKMADGGEVYLFATTLHNNTQALIACHKAGG
jgi:hypothetical protein